MSLSRDQRRGENEAGSVGRILRRGIVVSCQAAPGEPLDDPSVMAAMALSAASGGAVGIRANGPEDIHAIRRAVDLPIIGLFKADVPGSPVRITPTREHARAIVEAGAHIVAVDATNRGRLRGEELEAVIGTVVDLGLPVCADVATAAEARRAIALGATVVATTLAGYTDETDDLLLPAIGLVEILARELTVPILAEGGILSPEDAARAFQAGAYAVVVGSAITRPEFITRRFVVAARSVLEPNAAPDVLAAARPADA